MKDELKQKIKLNKEEKRELTKEYLLIGLISLYKDIYGTERRLQLLEKWKEYLHIIDEENRYLQFLINHIKEIRNEEKFFYLLNQIDLLNEMTFKYYDRILLCYEEFFEYPFDNKKIIPYRDFLTIIERNDLLEEMIGLILKEQDLYDYYSDELALSYLKDHTKILSCTVEEGMPFFGCFPKESSEVLTEINLCVPKIVDLKSMLVNVHEYKHGILLYPYLGQKVDNYESEREAQQEEEKFKTKWLCDKWKNLL